jgi:hypothetical protein
MWLFFGLPCIVFFVMGIIHASESIDKVKRNWNEYRCDPLYIPFAGMIRPDIGVEENFQHCMNTFGKSIFSFSVDAIMALFGDLVKGLGEIGSILPGFRDLLTKMRKSMLSFAAQTFGKITNSVGSIVFLLNKIRDILKRFAGEGYISMFLANTMIDSVMSFVMLCISIIKAFVYALLAMSFILALFQPELLVFAIVIASLLGSAGYM